MLIDVEIFEFDKNYSLSKKIASQSANIQNNEWILKDVELFQSENSILVKKNMMNILLSLILILKK